MPSVFKQKIQNGEWEPKYPEFAIQDGNPIDRGIADADTVAEDGGELWYMAPDFGPDDLRTSHLWGFRFFAASKHKFLRTLNNGESHLFVRFRPSGRQTSYSEYQYTFAKGQESVGQAVFESMKGHPDPGELVHSELIDKAVPYKPVRRDL
jgi:hypothetical protein